MCNDNWPKLEDYENRCVSCVYLIFWENTAKLIDYGIRANIINGKFEIVLNTSYFNSFSLKCYRKRNRKMFDSFAHFKGNDEAKRSWGEGILKSIKGASCDIKGEWACFDENIPHPKDVNSFRHNEMQTELNKKAVFSSRIAIWIAVGSFIVAIISLCKTC